MRKSLLFTAIFLASGCSNLSIHNPSSALLNDEDYQMEKRDSLRDPALSAPLDGKTPYWESYNHWQCFTAKSVEIKCLEADYRELVKVPALHIIYGSHYYEFSMDPEPKPNCGKITARWKELITDGKEFCVYAAFLQNYDNGPPDPKIKDGSVWIVNQIKTAKGSWEFETKENWLEEN